MSEHARLARIKLPLGFAASFALKAAHAAGDAAVPRLPADGAKLPAPGSYKLLTIQNCPDGTVLTPQARAERLHTLLRGRVTVLSFMYTYCRDPYGCPLANKAMKELHSIVQQDSALAAQTQMMSLSFDPTNDTPEQMNLYGSEYIKLSGYKWWFLTTPSVQYLMPLLNGLGQEVSVETDAKGQPTRTLNHMLKLFLIDKQMKVREIYSVNTVSAQAMANDMRTLLIETKKAVA